LRVLERSQRFLIQVTYGTPRAKIEALVTEIKQLTAGHPLTNKTNFHVRFNDFGESSLNIPVYFYFVVTDLAAELEAREEMLLRTMDLTRELGIDFAFPTRTLVIGGGSARGARSRRRRPRPPLING
jgi:MscS family membrane protein